MLVLAFEANRWPYVLSSVKQQIKARDIDPIAEAVFTDQIRPTRNNPTIIGTHSRIRRGARP